DLHLSGQGIHAPDVRRLAADRHPTTISTSVRSHTTPSIREFIIEGARFNWMWGTVYNLPLDEMMAVVDNALENGYPVAWGHRR
ncbi:MAG: hypothetical protein ACLUQ6_07945, partial [Alistipes onderdonkii]